MGTQVFLLGLWSILGGPHPQASPDSWQSTGTSSRAFKTLFQNTMLTGTGSWGQNPSSTSYLLSTLWKLFRLSLIRSFSFHYRDSNSTYLLELCENKTFPTHIKLFTQHWAHVHYQYTLVIRTCYPTLEFGATEGPGEGRNTDGSLSKESAFEEVLRALR